MSAEPTPTRVPGADPAVVGPYLARVLDEAAWADCTVQAIAGGRSNLTYTVDSAAGSVVLRRPPLRAVRPTAHDMTREHRVLSALAGTAVPVPRPLHLCSDPDVLGAPFYVMERVDGVIARGSLPPGYADTPAEREAMTRGLVDVLAELHSVDPDAVGLTGFGRPDGYLARQVRRWLGEWEALRDTDAPGVDALAADLAGRMPSSPSGPVVHGDYRLDNVVLDRSDPGRVAAVLDWEMSTLGDPLADVGLLLVYWQQGRARDPAVVTRSVTALPGFPTRGQVLAWYAERTGRDVSALPWYVAFGFFKLAVVVAGIVARQKAGAMVDNTDSGLAGVIEPLADSGRTALADTVPN
ncbi:MAG TPA: phosphotransferase family protein [Mycobacteriales bacterium]|nr:phosphotransferase family protein [Mycobacteriales bacterium]